MTAPLATPDHGARRRRWQAISLGVALPTAFIGTVVLALGAVAPYADTWIAAGMVRALSERPLPSFGVGGVPKAGQLLVTAAAVLARADHTAQALTAIGALSLCLCLVAHLAYWWRDLADDRRVEASIALALVATAPLAWRTTLEGSSIPWAWALILLALTALRRRTGLAAPTLALAGAALFRPEAVGSAMAIAIWTAVLARREAAPARRALVLLGALPLLVFALGVVGVDLIWTSRIGASARSYDAFVRAYAEVTPPLLVGVRLAIAATLLGVGAATTIGGMIGLTVTRLRHPPRPIDRSHAPLVAAVLGWLAVVLVHRIVGGGGFFDRFFFPLVTMLAAGAARLVLLPRRPSLSYALACAFCVSTLVSWVAYGPQVAGTAARGEAARAGAEIAGLFPANAPVATDLAVRAVAVGSGARAWSTTHDVNDPALEPCALRAIVVREGVLPAKTIARAARCGAWRNASVAPSQRERGIVVLVRE
jgi:hypothetical protein